SRRGGNCGRNPPPNRGHRNQPRKRSAPGTPPSGGSAHRRDSGFCLLPSAFCLMSEANLSPAELLARLFEHSPEPLTFLPIELQRRGGQMPRQDALDLLQGDDEHPERAKRKLLTLVRSQIIFENLADGMLYLNVRPCNL